MQNLDFGYFQNLIVIIHGSGLEVKGKRLIERPYSIGFVPFETFLLYYGILGDKPHRSLLYAEYILYIYLYLKIPSNRYKHLRYSNFKIPTDL